MNAQTKAKTESLLTRQILETTAQYLNRHSVAIIDLEDKGGEIASGTLIRIKDKFFVITAAHCLSSNANGRYWIMRRKEAYVSNGIPALIRVCKYPNEEPDVASIEIDASCFKEYFGEEAAITLDDIELDCVFSKEDVCIVSGFPAETVEVNDRIVRQEDNAVLRQIIPENLIYCCWPLDQSKWPTKFSINDNILLSYPLNELMASNGNEQAYLPEPYGISGGGMWCIRPEDKQIWSPQVTKLIGVQIEWPQPRDFIRGIRIQHWLKLIYQHYPDLQDEINSHFPKLVQSS